MKRKNEQLLKEVIGDLLDSYHLQERVNEMRLKENWEKIFGKTISKHTANISVRNNRLFLTITSASLRQELAYSKEKMIDRINEAIAEGFVKEVILR